MPTIMADLNADGHLEVLIDIWTTPDWSPFWTSAHCDIESFDKLAIPETASDETIWHLCQDHGILLLTCNRNCDGDDSLEAVIRRCGTALSLPVFTIADPDRVIDNRDYAERVAARLIEYLYDLENLRGTGRLYVP
jgi:hypothetical protein